MKVVILTIGTFGDIQPYAALGLGLRGAGYEVVLATHECFAEFVRGLGLKHAALAGDPQQWASGQELPALLKSGRNFTDWMRKLRQLADPLIQEILNSCWEASQGADLIIYSPLAWAGYSIAEKLAIPSLIASLQPMTPTKLFPSVWSPRGLNLGKSYCYTTHVLIQLAYWMFWMKYINSWRKNILKLNPISISGPFSSPLWKNQPHLYGFSSTLINKPLDWSENIHITGYWFIPEDKKWKPNKKLLDFLSSESPIIYIGFGSTIDSNPEQLRQIVVDYLDSRNIRAIVQGKWAHVFKGKFHKTILNCDYWIPHEWLFPRVSVIVHHGGASTVANALRANVPSLIIYHAWDQPFWGEHLHNVGISPNPISRHKLTALSFGEAVDKCLSDSSMRQRASAIGTQINHQDGIQQAVTIINRHVKGELTNTNTSTE